MSVRLKNSFILLSEPLKPLISSSMSKLTGGFHVTGSVGCKESTLDVFHPYPGKVVGDLSASNDLLPRMSTLAELSLLATSFETRT